MVKSKLSPYVGSVALKQLNPLHKKLKSFLFIEGIILCVHLMYINSMSVVNFNVVNNLFVLTLTFLRELLKNFGRSFLFVTYSEGAWNN